MTTQDLALPAQLTTGLPLTVELNAHPRTADQRAKILANPGFGSNFSDHMVIATWTEDEGWHDARLQAYQPFQIDPANAVLHYAQTIFEGLKAYRRADGTLASFRPEQNAARFVRSAHRLAMPPFPEDAFVAACDALVRIDADWVPDEGEMSLYLRPFMFASENFLGVRPAKQYYFCVIASPAAGYFSNGVSPVSVYASEDYVRAAAGGTGEAKCGGNYAGSLLAQQQATEQGCDQVVWLDSIERRYVEEMGGMNLFFVYGKNPDRVEIVTPELTGTLLPGITRQSLIEAADSLGLVATERRISLAEWRESVASGDITETFACGTAAVITPVGSVKARTGDFELPPGMGPITSKLRSFLLGIQHGTDEDRLGWIHQIA